jgi:hypothetical protein
MKKIFSIIAVVAAFVLAVPAQAQVQFGIKAGLNVNKVSLSDVGSNFDGENRTGFFAGVTADITLPIVGLGADISLLYDNKVAGTSVNDKEVNKTLQYIDVPINIKYTLGFSSLASVYLATGPQFAFNIGDRSWALSDLNKDWELKKSEFSWNVGAGVTVRSHIRIGYNYNIAIGKTAEFKVEALGKDLVKGKLKNNTHQISLTYLF